MAKEFNKRSRSCTANSKKTLERDQIGAEKS
jgi:hypothetical protein